MPQDDYAILVGISRYRDPDTYPPLEGPLNDVERLHAWLLADGVPENNIRRLLTDQALLELTPEAVKQQPVSAWSPTYPLFSDTFMDLVQDPQTGKFLRRPGRLYLYFSGHGFSVSKDQTPRAALFAANAFGIRVSNIAGSLFAETVQQGALFKEVVLIMDCCRDAEMNVAYNIPEINTVEDDGSEKVKVLQIYATQKRGKAQERILPDSDGKAVGLLTHALLKSLREAPTDVAGRIPSATLKGYVDLHWSDWFSAPVPPSPRIITPQTGDIFFQSRKPLSAQTFSISADTVVGTQLNLQSAMLVATGTVTANTVVWIANNNAWKVDIPLEQAQADGRRMFKLLLSNDEHVLSFPGTLRDSVKFVPGGADVISS
ncbi:hypothetical protein PS718_00521 [Pseudomonas fluorescens]|uniref:Peptidase C14 caspase domain-containing protein n=1 Tax=Pseudomonas fluorescens TaxID=294 RepID=A0A5E7A738_PSEFL|nr:caspase family protein [Pseudomonas fluorescens]VVN72674.1 hypothetical protein PS718_00521 [Pseudomonas fluorescens]